jgi:dTDP-4-dehydrorhamnose 3,5-epimerase
MRFVATPMPGAFEIEIEPREDARGYFARLWCRAEFAAHGIEGDMVQESVSRTAVAGTVRGMHLQLPPSREGKLVRCERGRVHDVIIDLRPDSPGFARHHAVTLDAARRNALYVPPGCAHGFQTLTDGCDVHYMMTDFYRPELQTGVRWDDPAFGIAWPIAEATVLPRDAGYPDFDPAAFAAEYARRAAG